MFGKNPVRKPVKGEGGILEVQEIFPTLQGEGVYTGHPSVFLRLGGCNLTCNFCDTEFETYQEMPIEDILAKIDELSRNKNGDISKRLIVITGGEPFRQPIEKICNKLIELGYKIQIETNGTLYRPIHEKVDIICSPKNNSGKGYSIIRDDLLKRINGFKFIISSSDEAYQDVGDVGQGKYNNPIYVQPMDEYNEEKNKENLRYTIDLALEKGYIMSLQTHKMIGIE